MEAIAVVPCYRNDGRRPTVLVLKAHFSNFPQGTAAMPEWGGGEIEQKQKIGACIAWKFFTLHVCP